MKPPILVTKRLPATVMSCLEASCEVDVHADRTILTPDALAARVAGKQGMICLLLDRIDRRIIDAGRDLQVIANVAVGFDNVDVSYATARGLIVTNTPDVLTGAVAELTWGLILAVARRIAEGDRVVERSAARARHSGAFAGVSPSGKAVVWTEIHVYRLKYANAEEMLPVLANLIGLRTGAGGGGTGTARRHPLLGAFEFGQSGS